MIRAQVQPTPSGAILFDAAAVHGVDDAWFDPAHWQATADVAARHAGRGNVMFFEASFGAAVLRHYHRGGLVAHLNNDRYLWTGRSRTRGFREFRLLAQLHDVGLRVPAPVLARYQRRGLLYRADLVTRAIPGARTLAARIVDSDVDAALAARVGRSLAGFHAQGVCHADLNAHNLVTDAAGEVWLLDFDRGRMRKPDMRWQQGNLDRLQRSLLKIGALRHLPRFESGFWHPLLAAYHRVLGDRALRGDGR